MFINHSFTVNYVNFPSLSWFSIENSIILWRCHWDGLQLHRPHGIRATGCHLQVGLAPWREKVGLFWLTFEVFWSPSWHLFECCLIDVFLLDATWPVELQRRWMKPTNVPKHLWKVGRTPVIWGSKSTDLDTGYVRFVDWWFRPTSPWPWKHLQRSALTSGQQFWGANFYILDMWFYVYINDVVYVYGVLLLHIFI